MAFLIQPSFARGEVSQDVGARVDLDQYRVGLATVRNAVIRPQGGFFDRPGLRFVAESKTRTAAAWDPATTFSADSWVSHTLDGALDLWVSLETNFMVEPGTDDTKWSPNRVCQLPFQFSKTQAYVLEFGHKYMRVFMKGGQVDTTDTSGVPVEIATPYTAAEVFALRFCQQADTLFLFHPNHAPAKMARASHVSWTLSDLPITNSPDWASGHPSCGCFYKQRLCMASSPGAPEKIAMSRSADYFNFNTNTADVVDGVPGDPLADDASVVELASNTMDAILWMVPLRTLLVGTVSDEWRVEMTSANAPIPDCDAQTSKGSEHIPPLTVGSTLLFVQRQGRAVLELAYALSSDGFEASDVTALADHLLESAGIVSWCYQQTPRSIVWAVREDGVLLGMTYMREHQVIAWHRHDTQGRFEAVASIPGDREDELWAVVRRNVGGTWRRYIERMEPEFKEDSRMNAFLLDSGLSYSGSAVGTLSGLDHLEGLTVDVLADGYVQKSKTVTGGQISLDREASVVHVGLPYVTDFQTLRLDGGAPDGTSQGRMKKLAGMKVLFRRTAGELQVGDDPDRLGPQIIDSPDPDNPLALFNGYENLSLVGGWERDIQIFIRRTQPLPMNILAIVPELVTGSK